VTSRPHVFFLFSAAGILGSGVSAGLIWLFGIEISAFERFSNFPDEWTLLELVWNATAALLVVGCIRAAYVALHAHYYGDPSDRPPNPGAGW